MYRMKIRNGEEMKFTINRTSRYYPMEDSPPCDKAVWECGKWFIEFETVEALSDFSKSDSIIVDGDHIEIYDEYRE